MLYLLYIFADEDFDDFWAVVLESAVGKWPGIYTVLENEMMEAQPWKCQTSNVKPYFVCSVDGKWL